MTTYLSRLKQVYFIPTTIALLLIFALALLKRLVAINSFGGVDYLDWTVHNYYSMTLFFLNSGDAIFQTGNYPQTGYPAGYSFLVYPPGYPIFLGFWRMLGADVTGLRIVQATLDAFAIFPLYWLLRRIKLSVWLSLSGGLVYAVYPLWSNGSVILMAEALAPLLIIWLMATLLWVSDDNTKLAFWVIPGIIISIATLMRPGLLLLIIPANIWLLWQQWPWRKTLYAMLIMGFGFTIFIGSWGVYNLKQHGAFIITTISRGAALWEGLGELPNDYGYVLDDIYTEDFLKSKGIDRLSIEGNRYLTTDYLRAWKEHPGFVLKVIWNRWSLIARSQDYSIFHISSITTISELWLQLFYQFFLIIFILAIVISYRNPTRLFVISMPLGVAFFSIGLVHYEPRYVRYVPLSYLVSIGICLQFISQRMLKKYIYDPRRRKTKIGSYIKVHQKVIMQYVKNIAILVIIFYAGYGTYNEWYQWQVTKTKVELLATLPNMAVNNELVQKYSSEELILKLLNDSPVQKEQDGWLIRLDENQQQVKAVIPVSGIYGVYIPFSLKLTKGEIRIIIYDDSDNILVQKHFYHKVGTQIKKGYLTVFTQNLDTITVVIINNNSRKKFDSNDSLSEFILSNIELYFPPITPNTNQ